MCVTAHPDDESLGMGGMLARYAAEGVATTIVCATRGERGWSGPPDEDPGPAALGRIREAELRAAAAALGACRVDLLDYSDGDLDRADPGEAIAAIAARIRVLRPQVVVTFGPDGAYGHPDHIAISQLTTAAVVAAADPCTHLPATCRTHRVAKLYYWAGRERDLAVYRETIGAAVMHIDGVERRDVAWPDWAITTEIDARAWWRQVWEAVTCHRSQMVNLDALRQLPEALHEQLWGAQTYYRAFSLVNGGRQVETDLFAGLR
jgi:LmbE family N-acetylglucosaminyl deacetylase